MQRSEYSEKFGISQSLIKAWKNFSPKIWKKKFIDKEEDASDENPAFLLGSILDMLITAPNELENRFYIANLEKLPSETECHIIECVYNKMQLDFANIMALQEFLPEPIVIREFNLESNKDLILECCNKEGWQSGWKDDTRVNKIIEKGDAYFKILSEANHRKIISSTLNMQAVELIEILKANKFTKNYLVESSDNELHFQLEIFAEYDYMLEEPLIVKGQYSDIYEPQIKKIPIKGALDILRINHKDQTIQIVDFKKAFSCHQFKDNIYKFGYDWQLSFYQFLLEFWLKENPKYLEYKQLPPINIVIDVVDREPFIYEYTQRDLSIAEQGNEWLYASYFSNCKTDDEYMPFRIKKGWRQLLDEICYHLVKNNFSCPREMQENGKIILNLNN